MPSDPYESRYLVDQAEVNELHHSPQIERCSSFGEDRNEFPGHGEESAHIVAELGDIQRSLRFSELSEDGFCLVGDESLSERERKIVNGHANMVVRPEFLNGDKVHELLNMGGIHLPAALSSPNPSTVELPIVNGESIGLHNSSSSETRVPLPRTRVFASDTIQGCCDTADVLDGVFQSETKQSHTSSPTLAESLPKRSVLPSTTPVPPELVTITSQDMSKLFQDSRNTTIHKLIPFWRTYADFRETEAKALSILNDRGVRMKRRKRIGSEVSLIQKREIRAQRNRERSQALRRHHKQRLGDLESMSRRLSVCNSSVRSLLHRVLECEEALPLLRKYFSENVCSEDLLAFLCHDTSTTTAPVQTNAVYTCVNSVDATMKLANDI